MDNERKINDEVEVLDFFDDEVEDVPTNVEEVSSYIDSTPDITPIMPEPEVPSYIDSTPEITPVMPEPEVPSYIDSTPEITPVMPEPEVPSYIDSTPEITPVMPEPEVPSYIDSTPEITPVMPEPEVPNFQGFEGMVEQDNTQLSEEPIVNTNNLNYSAFDVEDHHEEVNYTNNIMPTIEPTEIVKTEEEKKILKDVEASTPTNLNDKLLKLEDTLSKNNLKDDIKKEESKDESKSNKKGILFIVFIFVLLGVLIFFLPYLVKVF